MWREFTAIDNLELTSNMLNALEILDKWGVRPSQIKIQSYPSVKVFYYEEAR